MIKSIQLFGSFLPYLSSLYYKILIQITQIKLCTLQMSRLQQSASQQSNSFNSNRLSSPLIGNQQPIIDFRLPESQLRNNLSFLSETNMKLKQDCLIYKAILQGTKPNLVQQKRISPIEIVQVGHQWTTQQKPLQFNQDTQFKKTPKIVVNNVLPPPQPIIPSPNQQKRGDFTNINQVNSKNTTSVQSFTLKIQDLEKNLQNSAKKIADYKEKINKLQSLLHEKEFLLITEKNITLKQKETINELQSLVFQQKEKQQIQYTDTKNCFSCDQMSKKITQLTKQITELTNQLNTKTEKIQLLQSSQKNLRNFESKNKELQAEINKMNADFERRTFELQSQVSKLLQKLAVNQVGKQLEDQIKILRKDNLQLNSELKETERLTQERFGKLIQENQKLSIQLQSLRRQIEQRNDTSSQMSSSHQESLYQEYQRSIQMLQEQIYSLRQQIGNQEKGNSVASEQLGQKFQMANRHIEHLTFENGKLNDRLVGLGEEKNQLGHEMSGLKQRYTVLIEENHSLKQTVEELTIRQQHFQNEARGSVLHGNQEHIIAEMNKKMVMDSELELQLSRVHNQCAFLGNQVQRLNQSIAALQKSKALLTEQNQTLHLRLQQQSAHSSQQRTKQVQQTVVELENLRRANANLLSSVSTLENNNAQLNQRIADKERQFVSIRVSFEQQITQLRQSSQFEDKIQIMEKQIINKKTEIDQLKTVLSLKDQQLAHFRMYEQQIKLLNQQLQVKSAELSRVQNNLERKQAIVSSQQEEIIQLKQSKKQLQRNWSAEKSKDHSMQQTAMNLPQSVNNSELNDQHRNYERLIQELEIQKNTLHENLINAQNYIYEFEQKNYAQIIDQLHRTIYSLQTQRNNLLSRQKQLQHLLHTKDQVNTQKSSTQTPQHQHNINTYLDEISSLKHQISIIDSQIARLNQLNTQLQIQIHTLTQQNTKIRNLENSLKTQHIEDLEQLKLRIRQLENQRQNFLQNVDQIKNKLLAQQPQTMIQLDQSRVKVDKFIEENHRIIEKLRRAENHIQQMELRCQEYLAEIQRLRNGINNNFSIRDSKRTIINALENESLFDKTPIKKIDASRFYHSTERSGLRQNESLPIRIRELQEMVMGMKLQIQGRDDYIKKIQSKIVSLERERQSLQQNIARLTQAASTHETSIQELSAFNNQKRQSERLIVLLNNEKAVLTSENLRLNQQVITKSAQLVTVEKNWHDMRHKKQETEQINASLVEKVRVGTLEPNKSHLVEIQSLRQTIQGLELRIQDIERANGFLQNVREKSNKQLERLGQQNRELKTQIQAKNKESATQNNNTAILQRKINDFQATVNNVMQERTKLLNHTSELQQINRNLVDKIAELQKKSRSLQQTISSTVVVNPSNENQLTMLRNQLLIKEQQIQAVISNLTRAQTFIAQNQAIFFKEQQQKVQLIAKIAQLQQNITQLISVNEHLQKDISERQSPSIIDAQKQKKQLQLQLVQLQRSFEQISSQNNQLQQQLAIALEVKILKQSKEQGFEGDENKEEIIKNLSQQNNELKEEQESLSSQIQEWQQEVSNLAIQLKKLQAQHKELQTQTQKEREQFQRLIQEFNREKNHNKNLSEIIEKLRLESKNNQTRFTQFVDQQNALREELKSHYMNEFDDLQSQLTSAHQQLSSTKNQLSNLRLQLLTIQSVDPQQSAQQIERQRFLHQQQMERLKSQHRQEVEKMNDQNWLLQEQLSKLNALIENDSKTINDLKNQINLENQRHTQELILLRNQLQKDISSSHDTKYAAKLEPHIKTTQTNHLQPNLTQNSSQLNQPQDQAPQLQQQLFKLQARFSHVQQVKDEIFAKLREAQAYIIYLEQQIQVFTAQGTQQNQSIPAIQGVPEEVHNDVLEKLVHAQSMIMQLQNQPIISTQQDQGLIRQTSNLRNEKQTLLKENKQLLSENNDLIQKVKSLEKQISQIFHKHDQKLDQMNQRNFRIQQQLQITIMKEGEKHLQMMGDFEKFKVQNQNLETQLADAKDQLAQVKGQLAQVKEHMSQVRDQLSQQKDQKDQVRESQSVKDPTQKDTNARVLEQMWATIARISEQNKLLIQENQQVDSLKEQVQKLKQIVSQNKAQSQRLVHSLNKELKEKTLQVLEFEKALEAQVQQLYLTSTQLNKAQQQLSNKDNQLAQTSQKFEKQSQIVTHLSAQTQTFKAQLIHEQQMVHGYQINQQKGSLKTQLLRFTQSKPLPQQTATTNNNNQSNLVDSHNQFTNSLKQKQQMIHSLNVSLDNERYKILQLEKSKRFFQTKLQKAQNFISQTLDQKKLLTQKYQQLQNELQSLRIMRIQEKQNSQAGNNSIANISAINQGDEKLREMREMVENQQSMINESQMTITQLEVEMDSKNHELSDKQMQIESLKRTIRKLEEEKESLTQIINKLNDITSNLNEKITDLNVNVKELQNKIIQINDKNSSLSNKVSDMQSIIKNLEKQLSDERQVKEQLNNTLQQSTNAQNNMSEATQSQILSLQQTLETRTKEIASLKETIDRLEDDKLTIEMSGRQAFSKQLEAHKKLNEELIKASKESNNQLNLLRDKALQATELKHSLSETQLKLKHLQQQLKDHKLIKQQLNQYQSLIQTLNQDKLHLEVQKDSLVQELNSLAQGRDHLIKQKSSLIQQINTLTREKSSLQNKLLQQHQKISQQSSFNQQQLEKFVHQIKNLNQIIQNQTTELDFFKTHQAQESQKVSSLKKQLQQTKQQSQFFESKLNEEKKKSVSFDQTINDLRAQNDELKAKVEKQTNGAKQHVRKALQHVKRASQMQGSLKQLNSQIEQTKFKLLSTTKQLQQTRNQLSQSAPQLADSKANITQLEKQLSSAKSQNQHLVEQLVQAESQITKHPIDLKMLQSQKNSQIQLLNDKITQQNREISQFIKLQEHLMDEISEEHIKLEKKQAEFNDLNTKLAQFQNVKKQLTQKDVDNKQLLKELNDARAQKQGMKLELSQFLVFKQKLFEAETYTTKLQQSNKQLQQKVISLQQKLGSTEVLKKSVEQKSDLLSSRELQISSMSVDLKEISNKLSDKQQQLLMSQKQLIQIKRKISQMEMRIDEEQRAKTALKLQLDSSIENINQLSVLNDRLTQKEKVLQTENAKNKDLQNRRNQLAEALIKLQLNNNQLNTTVNQLTTALNDLQHKNNNLFNNMQKLNTQLSALQHENTRLKDQLKQLQNMSQIKITSHQNRIQITSQQHSFNQPSQQLQDEVEQLKLKLLYKEQQLEDLRDQFIDLNSKLANYEIDIDNYRKIIQETNIQHEAEHQFHNYHKVIQQTNKQYQVEQEIEKLKDNLKNADYHTTDLETQFQTLAHNNQQLLNQNNSLKLQLNQLNHFITQIKNQAIHDKTLITQLQATLQQLQSNIKKLQSSAKNPPQSKLPQDSYEKITKIVQKLTKYVAQNDSVDVFLEQNIQKDIAANPVFQNLYQTIKYKLTLLNAIDKEKTVTLSQKERASQQLINSMKKLQDQKKQMLEKVSQSQILEVSYNEVLAKLIEMERLNISLENEVNQLNNQLSLHKSQIEEFQSKFQNESSSLSAQVSGQGERNEGQGNAGGDLFIDQQLKQQNLRLRKQLEEALYDLHKLRNNTSNFESFHNSPVMSPFMNKRLNENNQFFKEFLRDCLMNIGNLEDSVSGIEKDLMDNKHSIERLLMNKNSEKPALGSKGSEDSWMLDKIQQLEDKLLQNERKLKEYKNRTEIELINFVRDSVINPLTNQAQLLSATHFDREKVENYLRDLEDIILRKDIAHDEEINRLKFISEKNQRYDQQISPKKQLENEQAFDIDDLLKQIAGLHKHIQYFHGESERRKAQYKSTIQDLLQQIELLKKQYENIPVSTQAKPIISFLDNIAAKTKSLLDQKSLQDFDQKSDYLNDDDFIVSNNYVQWITKKGGIDESPNKDQEQHFVHDLKSIAEEFQNKESSIPSRNNFSNVDNNQNPTSVENRILNLSNNVSKEELLSRPILQFIIQNKEFDEQEINLLKKKINELQSRSSQQKMKVLKDNQKKVTEALSKHNLVKEVESPQKQVKRQTALNTLCVNLTKEQVQKLVFCSNNQEDLPEEIVIKMQEVLSCNSLEGSSFLKSDSNVYEMMQTILEIKVKHYPEPTPLSEEMFHHLVRLLSSKDNLQFYALVDSLFSYLCVLENDFLITLKQKQQMYLKHTQKMNQVLGLDNDSSDQDLDLQDQHYYNQILLLTNNQQAQIQQLNIQSTQKDVSEQLEQQLSKAVYEHDQR